MSVVSVLHADLPDWDAVAMATRPRRSTDTSTSRTIARVFKCGCDWYVAEARQSCVRKRAFEKSKLIWRGALSLYRLAYNNLGLLTLHVSRAGRLLYWTGTSILRMETTPSFPYMLIIVVPAVAVAAVANSLSFNTDRCYKWWIIYEEIHYLPLFQQKTIPMHRLCFGSQPWRSRPGRRLAGRSTHARALYLAQLGLLHTPLGWLAGWRVGRRDGSL